MPLRFRRVAKWSPPPSASRDAPSAATRRRLDSQLSRTSPHLHWPRCNATLCAASALAQLTCSLPLQRRRSSTALRLSRQRLPQLSAPSGRTRTSARLGSETLSRSARSSQPRPLYAPLTSPACARREPRQRRLSPLYAHASAPLGTQQRPKLLLVAPSPQPTRTHH